MTDTLGYSRSTFYFNSEGRINLDKTIELVAKSAKKLNIKKVVVFTANGEGALKLKTILESKARIIAVTFPYKQPFYIKDPETDEEKQVWAETSKEKVCQKLKDEGIILVRGVMPFEDIPIMGTNSDTKIQTINNTLSLVSGGLKLCIEALVMSSDAGHIEQGEEVIVFSADTAIVATGCRKRWLFHPEEGLTIKEFICKPSSLSISRKISK